MATDQTMCSRRHFYHCAKPSFSATMLSSYHFESVSPNFVDHVKKQSSEMEDRRGVHVRALRKMMSGDEILHAYSCFI